MWRRDSSHGDAVAFPPPGRVPTRTPESPTVRSVLASPRTRAALSASDYLPIPASPRSMSPRPRHADSGNSSKGPYHEANPYSNPPAELLAIAAVRSRKEAFIKHLGDAHEAPFHCWLAIVKLVDGIRSDAWDSLQARNTCAMKLVHAHLLRESPLPVRVPPKLQDTLCLQVRCFRWDPNAFDALPYLQLREVVQDLLAPQLERFRLLSHDSAPVGPQPLETEFSGLLKMKRSQPGSRLHGARTRHCRIVRGSGEFHVWNGKRAAGQAPKYVFPLDGCIITFRNTEDTGGYIELQCPELFAATMFRFSAPSSNSHSASGTVMLFEWVQHLEAERDAQRDVTSQRAVQQEKILAQPLWAPPPMSQCIDVLDEDLASAEVSLDVAHHETPRRGTMLRWRSVSLDSALGAGIMLSQRVIATKGQGTPAGLTRQSGASSSNSASGGPMQRRSATGAIASPIAPGSILNQSGTYSPRAADMASPRRRTAWGSRRKPKSQSRRASEPPTAFMRLLRKKSAARVVSVPGSPAPSPQVPSFKLPAHLRVDVSRSGLSSPSSPGDSSDGPKARPPSTVQKELRGYAARLSSRSSRENGPFMNTDSMSTLSSLGSEREDKGDPDSLALCSSESSVQSTNAFVGAPSRAASLGGFDFNRMFQECVKKLRLCDGLDDEDAMLHVNVSLLRMSEDFLSYARRFGRIIISEVFLPLERKTIRPVALGGVIGGEKYMVHNILFKFAVDRHGVFGHDHEIASKIAGHELKGLRAYFSTRVVGLHFPLMALIDFLGFRIIATSVLPLAADSLIYGSPDGGVTVRRDKCELNALVRVASQMLNLKGHPCGPDRCQMYSACDLEGHIGTDGRFYLLDFSRSSPPVTPSSADQKHAHLYQLFRFEFLQQFRLYPLCSDAYSSFMSSHQEEAKVEVDMATKELVEHTTVHFARDLIHWMDTFVASGGELERYELTESLHRAGINCRFLGVIARHVGRHPYGQVVMAAMVGRIIKLVFRRHLRERLWELEEPLVEPHRVLALRFLNTVFSDTAESTNFWDTTIRDALSSKFGLRSSNYVLLPPVEGLKVCAFRLHKLKGEFNAVTFDTRTYLLRYVINTMGIQVAPHLLEMTQENVMWAQEDVFLETDIIAIGDRVKHMDVISNARGTVLLATGQMKEDAGLWSAASMLYRRALQSFETSLRSNPLNVPLLHTCARTLVRIDSLEKRQKRHAAVLSEKPKKQRSIRSMSSLPSVTQEGDHHGLNGRLGEAPKGDNSFEVPAEGETNVLTPLLARARSTLMKALQADPRNVETHLQLALLLRDANRVEEAESHFLQAATAGPTHVPTLQAYADFLCHTRNNVQLADRFRFRAMRISTASQDVKRMRTNSRDLGRVEEESTVRPRRASSAIPLLQLNVAMEMTYSDHTTSEFSEGELTPDSSSG